MPPSFHHAAVSALPIWDLHLFCPEQVKVSGKEERQIRHGKNEPLATGVHVPSSVTFLQGDPSGWLLAFVVFQWRVAFLYYSGGTFVLTSTKVGIQPDGSPCTESSENPEWSKMSIARKLAYWYHSRRESGVIPVLILGTLHTMHPFVFLSLLLLRMRRR